MACLRSEIAPLTTRAADNWPGQGQTLRRSDVRFEPKGALDGETEDGLRFSSEIWEGSDGTAVFLRRQYCLSPESAEIVLLQREKEAGKILETKFLTGKKGTKSGRRIVVSSGSDTKLQLRMILWTDGNMLYTVESSSFEHALLFEKLLLGL